MLDADPNVVDGVPPNDGPVDHPDDDDGGASENVPPPPNELVDGVAPNEEKDGAVAVLPKPLFAVVVDGPNNGVAPPNALLVAPNRPPLVDTVGALPKPLPKPPPPPPPKPPVVVPPKVPPPPKLDDAPNAELPPNADG